MTLQRLRFLIPLSSILAALVLSAFIIAALGRDPVMIAQKMVRATIASPYGIGQVLFRTTTLVLVGVAVALPFQVRLFNIGAEGQLLMGAFSGAMAGALLPASLPMFVALPIALLVAMLAGAFWAIIVGVLKISFGVNEVISTIMLNFLAQGVTGYFLTYHVAVPSTVHTADIIQTTTIPSLSAIAGLFMGSPANLSTFIAIAMALLFYVMLFRSRFGYEMRAAGLQPEAARYGGINAAKHTLLALAMGGAVAGLGAANVVFGYKHYYESGMTTGIGFTGIAVALLAEAHPLWIILSALFFGFLEYGGLTVNAWIPKDIFMVIEALTILLFIVFNTFSKKLQSK